MVVSSLPSWSAGSWWCSCAATSDSGPLLEGAAGAVAVAVAAGVPLGAAAPSGLGCWSAAGLVSDSAPAAPPTAAEHSHAKATKASNKEMILK